MGRQGNFAQSKEDGRHCVVKETVEQTQYCLIDYDYLVHTKVCVLTQDFLM